MNRCTSQRDVTERILKPALNIIRSSWVDEKHYMYVTHVQ